MPATTKFLQSSAQHSMSRKFNSVLVLEISLDNFLVQRSGNTANTNLRKGWFAPN